MTVPRLCRRLRLQEAKRVSDGAGGFRETWDVLGTLWAEVVPGQGREVGGEDAAGAQVPYRITLRGAAIGAARRPKPGQRLCETGRVFHILAVTERDARGRYLTCFAREEVVR